MNTTPTVTRLGMTESTSNKLILAASVLPGLVCYQMLAMHAPMFVIVPFYAFFGYMGISAMVSASRKNRSL